jgi:hypothetical protein
MHLIYGNFQHFQPWRRLLRLETISARDLVNLLAEAGNWGV